MWMNRAKADLAAADGNLRIRQFYVSVFLCHQAVEKGLSALYVECRREVPPRSHDVLRLAVAVNLPARLRGFVTELMPSSVMARYPDAADADPAQTYSRRITEIILKNTTEVLDWIRKQCERSGRSSAA